MIVESRPPEGERKDEQWGRRWLGMEDEGGTAPEQQHCGFGGDRCCCCLSHRKRGVKSGHTTKGKGTREKKRDLFSFLPSSTTVVDDLPSLHWFLCAWLAWIMEAPTTMVVGGGEIMPPIQQKTSIFAPSAIPTPRPCMPSAHRRQDLRTETLLM